MGGEEDSGWRSIPKSAKRAVVGRSGPVEAFPALTTTAIV